MIKRDIIKKVQGYRTTDGAGVSLVRVLGYNDVKDFDPFLMLDSFDSVDPADYTAGFPTHPHRGIETVTYLISGKIEHEDSLGNKGSINSGESQWMSAGSGILHLFCQSSNLLLFLFENISVRQNVSPPKK